MKRKLRLKKYVVACLYVVLFTSVMMGAFLVTKAMKKANPSTEDNYTYVSSIITDNIMPTISETKKMINPYTDQNVTVGKSYYDYKAEAATQEKSITYYDGSYIQNSGIDFVSKDSFDVVAVLDGTVTSVKQDDVLGTVVEIKHDNNYVTTYQSLNDVDVKKDDTVTQGQVIGKSGTNKIDKDMGNHLHFELYVNGQVVDPNLYLNKDIPANDNSTTNKTTTNNDTTTNNTNKSNTTTSTTSETEE